MMTENRSPAGRWKILGVRLREQDPVLDVEIPLGRGMTALAGINGVGKSLVLRGVASALNGSTDFRDSPLGHWHLLVERDTSPLADHGTPLDVMLDGCLKTLTQSGDAYLAAWSLLDKELASDSGWSLCRRSNVAGSRVTTTLDFTREDVIAAICGARLWCVTGSRAGLHLQPALDPMAEEAAVRAFLEDCRSTFQGALGVALDWEEDEEDGFVEVDSPDFMRIYADDFYGGMSEKFAATADLFKARSLPLPINPTTSAGVVLKGWPRLVADVDSEVDVERRTSDLLSSWLDSDDSQLGLLTRTAEFRPLIELIPDGLRRIVQDAGYVPEEVWKGAAPITPHAHAEQVSDQATATFKRLTGSQTQIVLRIAALADWPKGPLATWGVIDGISTSQLRIEDLSRSHQRWARYSITSTIGDLSGGTVLVADEPEAGVHRSAEKPLAQELAVVSGQAMTIIATHSPAFLSASDHRLLVRRGPAGEVLVESMVNDPIESADALGLEPQDLLGWYRQFLVVEGHHDELVITKLFGPESQSDGQDLLTKSRTRTFRISGVKGNSGSLTASLLSDFSVGRLIVLVDGIGSDAADRWATIVAAADRGIGIARNEAREAFRGDAFEMRFLREVVSGAKDAAVLRRVAVIGLPVPDILDLLPVGPFVSSKQSWDELRNEYLAYRKRRAHDHKPDFKEWLREHKDARINDKTIRAAIDQLDRIPPELDGLIVALQG